MAERNRNIREDLILAGIDEINAHGVAGFSVRRVAERCRVSSAAPYRHFQNKRGLVAAIIDYVNGQWSARQEEIIAGCGDSLRRQLVEISTGYIRFLMEKPFFRGILMLKDEQFDNIYHRVRGQLSSRSQQILTAYCAATDWDEETIARKRLVVRSLIFGSIVMFDSGEISYDEQTMERIRLCIDREFDLP